jgi:putative transposase
VRDGLLPSNVLQQIPRSNLWRWKNESADKYRTFDLNLKTGEDYELIRSFALNNKAKRVFSAYVRLSTFFVELVQSIPKFRNHISNAKIRIIKAIEKGKGLLGLLNILRVFGIPVSTFRQWRLETHTSCFNSIMNKCNRIYPTQLSKIEVKLMKDKLIDPFYQYWPISSIAFDSLRNGSLPLHLNTWYKYAKQFGVIRLKPNHRRKKQRMGVRAQRPNQIWHADITRFVTVDNAAHYIYLVVDNFSRKILSWAIAEKVSASVRRHTIDDALKSLSNNNQKIVLITDGGPENSFDNNSNSFVHFRALIDIRYSNSLIEAHNKVIKYNYLYPKTIANGVQLRKEVKFSINDFNNRPHISLDGSTPNECHAAMKLDHEFLRKLKIEAQIKRKLDNLKSRCEACTD